MKYDLFKRRLLEEMRSHDVDEYELADMLNVSIREVRRILLGHELPKVDILEDICKALHTTPNYLLGFGEGESDCKLAPCIRDMDLFNEFLSILEKPYKYCVTGTCKECSLRSSINCFDILVANELVNRGYVRASVLAKKIFEDIKNNSYINVLGYAHINGIKFEDLEKKYGG